MIQTEMQNNLFIQKKTKLDLLQNKIKFIKCTIFTLPYIEIEHSF